MTNFFIAKDNLLILASKSPRRKEILEQIKIPFEVIQSKAEETFRKELGPEENALQTAILKADLVRQNYRHRWILAADTIVTLKGKIFGKPGNAEECLDMLLYLQGEDHHVITAFCIFDQDEKKTHLEAVTTLVKIKEMTKIEIYDYISTGEPFGKAGGYAIQGIGSFMVKYIKGSYTNVVGLPVHEVVNALYDCSAIKSFPIID